MSRHLVGVSRLMLCTSALAADFDTRVFSSLLRSGFVGHKLFTHQQVASTMTIASDLVAQGGAAAHGSVVIAETQTAGVGRRGRSWQDSPGRSLLFSMVWAPSSPGGMAELLPELVRLNLAAPVAVARACRAVGVGDAKVKWPNDVLVGEPPKKLSGVLLDFNGQDAAVLGVGVNVLQDMDDHPTATSIATLLRSAGNADGAITNLRERVLVGFCSELEGLMRLSSSQVISEHRELHLLEGRTVRVHHRSREEDDPRDYDARVLGVSEDGRLRVLPGAPGSEAERLLSGEEVSITPR